MPSPTGQVRGTGRMPNSDSISSISSRGARPGRSHLLMNVMTGTPRLRQTRYSLRVWVSMPRARSMTTTAASAAHRVR